MSITEQAIYLLDISPSIQKRKCLENFASLESEIRDSIAGPAPALPPEAIAALPEKHTPYAVAARMGRSNYEEQAKAEALHNALRQMRAKRGKPPPRVIRGS